MYSHPQLSLLRRGKMSRVYVLILCSIPFVLGMGNQQSMGKEFVLNFDSDVYVCADAESETFIDTSQLQATRLNETTAMMSGYFTLMKGLGPTSIVELVVMKDTGKSFETVTTHELCDICDELGPKDQPTMYTPYLEFIDFPHTCPIEAGEYRIHEMTTDTKEMPINAANAGRYQVTVNFYDSLGDAGACDKDKLFLGCVKLDLLIEPLE